MTIERIGPFRVLRPLGTGGMGSVYLATSASGRAVAVKVVRPQLATDSNFRRRFAAEVAAARAVSGAFTAPVVAADPDGPLPWLATAYVAGPTLRHAIGEHGPMPAASLRVLGAGLAEALVAIHEAGIVHRDLKPANILLAADGPRVIDFGISKAADADAVTADGDVVGSAGYMSPEHITGATLTPASDVFSLGAVLAFAATGEPPFGTGSFHALLFRTVHEPPRLDAVPAELRDPVAACLDKDPAKRPTPHALPALLGAAPNTRWLPGPVEADRATLERTLVATLAENRRRRLPSRRGVLLAGGIAVAAAAAGGVYAFAASGSGARARWTATLPRSGMAPLTANAGTLICADQAAVAAYDLASGERRWAQDASAVAADPARVYAARGDGRLHAVDPRTGRDRWSYPNPNIQQITPETVVVGGTPLAGLDAATGERRWSHPTGQGGVHTVAGGGLLVYLGSSSSHALDITSGAPRWSRPGPLRTLHAPATSGVLYALDDDMNLLALRAATGGTVWRRPTNLPPPIAADLDWTDSLRLDRGTLLCHPRAKASPSGLIAAFDPGNGRELWRVNTAAGSGYAIVGAILCYLDTALHAVDARTGRARWSATAPGPLQFVGAAGEMFLAGSQGELHGFAATTGRRIWRYADERRAAFWSALDARGRLLVAHADKVFAFGLG